MKPKGPYRKHRKATQVDKAKTEKVVCQSCIAKFVRENGRKPAQHEKSNMAQDYVGCECENCYKESLFEFAGIKPVEDYQTMTQAVWLAGF